MSKGSKKLIFSSRIILVALAGLMVACSQDSTQQSEMNVTTIQPGARIPWTELAGDAGLASVDSTHWQDVPVFQLDLSPVPPVHASVQLRRRSAAETLPLRLQTASDGSQLLLRLVWADESHNAQNAWEQFPDGAAVQFVLGDAAQTTHMMGSNGFPVNIWYWNAARQQPQNLAAAGFGGTTVLPQQNVTANAIYNNIRKEWQLVLARSLNNGGEYTVPLGQSDEIQLAFAVWQGASGQRDGDKRTSTGWITLGHSEDQIVAVTELPPQ